MYLVIAEKPSVSKSIADVLGASKRNDGYLEGNDCIVSWCLGHLAEYVAPNAYDPRFEKWNFEDLPIIPTEWKLDISKDKKDQFYILKRLLNQPDIQYVVNACDAGREGELIFHRVYELSGSKKPVKRLWISSMEDVAIQKGFQDLKDGGQYENLKQAAICRAKADWLVGMNGTRAYTSTYYKKLTVGRVQTPTLAMLVERSKQVSNFQKEKYFNVELDCDGLIVKKEKIFEETTAKNLEKSCHGRDAIIEEIIRTEKTESPPKLYDLTTLQREANRHFGLTAQQTLNAAQSLYEEKLITYPRTDSQFLTEDMESTIKNVIGQIHKTYQPLGPFEQPSVPNIKRVMNSKKVSDHHAIIPTMQLKDANLSTLKDTEQKILFLIAIHTIQATSENHIYTDIEINVQCQKEHFTAKEKETKQLGWRIYDECFKNKDGTVFGLNQEEKHPLLSKHEKDCFHNVFAKISEHFTSPPKQYSEDTLLSAMETAGNKEFDENTEKKGLGTPATRASVIEKLVHSQYATRKGKQILPTEDGMALIEILPSYLKSASMTAEWENQLLEIEQGKFSSDQFLTGIENLVSMIINGCEILSDEETRRFQTRSSIGTCPVCGSLVYEGKSNFYCSNRDCNFVLWKENRYLQNMQKTIDAKIATELLKNGKAMINDLYSRKKNAYFEAYLIMKPEDNRISFSLEFPKNNKKPNNKKGRK